MFCGTLAFFPKSQPVSSSSALKRRRSCFDCRVIPGPLDSGQLRRVNVKGRDATGTLELALGRRRPRTESGSGERASEP